MFTPETNRWIKIHYTQNGKPFFYHKGKRISMKFVVRTHHNPWIGDVFPDYIHGYYALDYFNPLFVQINGTGEAVKVYKVA